MPEEIKKYEFRFMMTGDQAEWLGMQLDIAVTDIQELLKDPDQLESREASEEQLTFATDLIDQLGHGFNQHKFHLREGSRRDE